MAVSKLIILLCFMTVGLECQHHQPDCIFLKKSCVDYSCYERCPGVSFKNTERDYLKVCGNSTFLSCFMKHHIEEISHCGKRYRQCLQTNATTSDDDETNPNLQLMIWLTSIISPVLFVAAVVCYCRIYMRSRLQTQKKCYSIELPGNDLSLPNELEVRVSWIDPTENEIKTESVWNNIYIRKLQDYETSEEEDSTCDCEEI